MNTPNLQKAYANNQRNIPDLEKVSNLSNSLLTDSLIRKAIEKNIPIYENKELLDGIAKLDLLKDTPDKYYSAVSDLISFIYKIDKKQN